MNSDKANFVPSNAVGVNRVLKDNGTNYNVVCSKFNVSI